jgi:hypothetical protein
MKKLALPALALVVALPAFAQNDNPKWPSAMWPSDNSCPTEKIQDVRLEDILKRLRGYTNQCVRVKGYYHYGALFVDPDEMVIKYAPSSKKTEDRRIGVSGSDEAMRRLNSQYDQQYVELVGIIWQCKDTGPWLGGYCHYVEDGPFIGIKSVKATREPARYRDN